MNPLDKVIPDGYRFDKGPISKIDTCPHGGKWRKLYDETKVESLLSQCRQDVRKEALLEAADAMVRLRRGFNFGLKDQALCEAESELRRMAEREK